MGHGKKVTVDLRANESLTVEVPLTEGGESLYARFWLWLVSSGKWAAMSGAAAKTYGALLARADFTTLDCWPSVPTIAQDSGLSQRAVYGALQELVQLGVISRDSGKGVNNRYTVVRPPLQNLHGSRNSTPAKSARAPLQKKHPTPAKSAPKQKTQTKPKKLCMSNAAREDLSEEASQLRAALCRLDVQPKVGARLIEAFAQAGKLEWVWNAIKNCEALATAERLRKTPAAYIVGALQGALDSESPVTLTRLALKRRARELAAQAARENTRTEQRTRRQAVAAKRWGDPTRWAEIGLEEVGD